MFLLQVFIRNGSFEGLTTSSQCCKASFLAFSSLDKPFPTLAAFVLALSHLETTILGLSILKNDTELLFRAAKSNAFHLQKNEYTNVQKHHF